MEIIWNNEWFKWSTHITCFIWPRLKIPYSQHWCGWVKVLISFLCVPIGAIPYWYATRIDISDPPKIGWSNGQPQPVTQVDPSSLPSFSPSLLLPWPQKSPWTGRHRRRSRCPGGLGWWLAGEARKCGYLKWIHLRFLRWTTLSSQFSLEFQRFWYGCVQKLMGKIEKSMNPVVSLHFGEALQEHCRDMKRCVSWPHGVSKDGWRHISTSCILPVGVWETMGNRFHIFPISWYGRTGAASQAWCFRWSWRWPRHPSQIDTAFCFRCWLKQGRLPWQLRDAKSTVNGCGGLPHGFLGSLHHTHWWAAARIGYPSKNLGARSPQQARLVLHDNKLQGIRRFQTHFESICVRGFQ